MEEEEKKMLIDEHVLFISGDPNLVVAGMEREWPEGRGVFISEDRKFSAWVNEEDQLRIVSMEKVGKFESKNLHCKTKQKY